MIDINTVIAIFVFITGACIGSFLNVVALRGLSGESIILPPSKCPKCNKKLNWYTNIPIISYIFLGGKCEFCKEPVSLQYPIVEFLNAFFYLTAFLSFGYSIKTLFLFPVISMFLVLAATDLKESVILDVHAYIIMALGLIYALFPQSSITILSSILGLVLGLVFFEGISRLGCLFAGTRAFGEGDTLIAMGMGALFGPWALFLAIFMSVLIQTFFTLPMLFNKALKNKDYKSAGAYIALVLCVISVYLFRKFNLYENFPLILILLLIVCFVLILSLIVILKDIRNKKDTGNFLYLPFGPALVASGLIMIFYQPEILEFVNNFLGL